MLLHYLFPLYLILFAGDSTCPLPDNECNDCISRSINEYVEFSTPPGEEIIFNKIIREHIVYRIQFKMSSDDYKVSDSAAYLELTNNTQVGRLRVPIVVEMTKSMRKPFILMAAFDLSTQEIESLSNYGIKSFAIGKQKCPVKNKKQETLMQYFRCLMKAG